MKNIEYIAVSEYLSHWPEKLGYDEIIEALSDKDLIGFPDGFEPCEFFEDWYPPTLAERINNLKQTIETQVIGRKNQCLK